MKSIDNPPTEPRQYYSVRNGKPVDQLRLNLPTALRLICSLYISFDQARYFQEHFGYFCVDEGTVPGLLGQDLESALLLKLRRQNLWPIGDRISFFSEDELFDVLEFLFDHCSKPDKGRYHGFNNCGWHYTTFDGVSGRAEFRQKVNEVLLPYSTGYQLSENGEVLHVPESGLDLLIAAPIPETANPANVEERIERAKKKFLTSRASLYLREDAVRDLASVAEYLRPRAKAVLTRKDEADLFELANRFAIRHNAPDQKSDYDKSIWYSWMFYHYLATIHALLRLEAREH